MNPDDFLSLATRLASGNSEAEKRSAVSRAYYGVFHCARLLIVEECEVTFPETAEAHTKIAICLQHSGNLELQTAGAEINTFRATRNKADYSLSDQRFDSPKFIQVQLEIAIRIFNSLKAGKGEIGSIRPMIRKFARETLKLLVRGKD